MLCIIFKKFDVAFMNLIAAIMDCLNIFWDEQEDQHMKDKYDVILKEKPIDDRLGKTEII